MSLGNLPIIPPSSSGKRSRFGRMIERRQDEPSSSSSASSSPSSVPPVTEEVSSISELPTSTTVSSTTESGTTQTTESTSTSSSTSTSETTSPSSTTTTDSSTTSSTSTTSTSASTTSTTSSSTSSSSTTSIDSSTTSDSISPSSTTSSSSSFSRTETTPETIIFPEATQSSPLTAQFIPTSIAPELSTSLTTSSIPTGTNSPVGASSTPSFWSNKGAVAGTFTALALIVLGLLLALVFYIRRKRRAASYRDTIYSDKIPVEPGLASTPSRPTSSSDHGTDAEDFHGQPMDGNAGYYSYDHQNADPFADIHHPPYPNGSLPEITYSYAKDVNNQYPYYDEPQANGEMAGGAAMSTSSHSTSSAHQAPQSYFNPLNPFNNPQQTSQNPFSNPKPYNQQPYFGNNATSGRTAPTSTPERDSTAYQPSVDSFYRVSTDGNVGQAR
ncbi:hypothetical protein VNI00_001223 [Paramarasmius palmivorus]|uniref:Uncharacterized protein n=1 Tax=Paramarasmius palmivorus TaxID=297713 RepID=A0AAW0E5C3_9AGAR